MRKYRSRLHEGQASARELIADFPEQDIFDAMVANQVKGVRPFTVMRELYTKNAKILNGRDVSMAAVRDPGRSMNSVRRRFFEMVERDAKWRTAAKRASLWFPDPV